ncbi:MAG TPA: hypothetical protein VII76_13425 [Acidimicrobiales bacterium]
MRRAARLAPVFVAVAVLAAACSSSPPVGQVGATLSAMSGTVTLDKVLSPAPVQHGSVGPPYGHKLVAVVLTVHSPATAAAKFAAIYHNSKLVDSKKLAHIGKSAAKYQVSACAAYPPFGALPAGQSATGCVVFLLPTASTPVELKISGKAEADWTIAATAIQPGTAPTPVASVPTATAPPAVPLTGGSGTTTTAVPGATTTTVTPGTLDARGTTTTTSAGSGNTATTTSGTPAARHPHHVVSKGAKIVRVTPRAGPVGSRVLISGRRLGGATQVTFNGVPAFVKKAAAGKIVAVVPVGATNGPVVVTTPAGTVTSPRSFVVL